MKHILLILITPLLLTRLAASSSSIGINCVQINESEAQTYLKLYTTVSGTAENRQENWLLANSGTRRIMATIEIVSTSDDGKALKETKNVIIESGTSAQLGLRSANGSAPNTVVVIKAWFTAAV